MTTRARTELIRFLVATYLDLHRHCRIYFAELEDSSRARRK